VTGMRAAAIIAATVCAASGSARADAYNATLTRAIAAKERAMDVNEPARWEEALRLFQEADAIRATREASYELGFAAERLARTDLAVEAYEAALNLGLTGQPRGKAEAFVGAHAAALARVQIKGAGEGRVRSGGVERGKLPLRRPLVLFPGDTVIEVVDGHGNRASHRLKLTAGQLEILDLSAAAAAPAPAPSPVPAPAPSPVPAPSPSPALAPVPSPSADAPSPAIVLSAPPTPRAAASAPPPAPPPSPAEPATAADRPAAGWWFLGAGVALAAGGGVMVAVSQIRLDAERADLRATCDVLNGTDACTHSNLGMETQAQNDVDAIATWKAVRIGSWIGLGAGVAAAGYGVWTLVRGNRSEAAPTIVVIDRGLALGWIGRF
jgi:hypothetical protein